MATEKEPMPSVSAPHYRADGTPYPAGTEHTVDVPVGPVVCSLCGSAPRDDGRLRVCEKKRGGNHSTVYCDYVVAPCSSDAASTPGLDMLNGFKRSEPDDDHSTLHCLCGATFTWTGPDAKLGPWCVEHEEHQSQTPDTRTRRANERRTNEANPAPKTALRALRDALVTWDQGGGIGPVMSALRSANEVLGEGPGVDNPTPKKESDGQ